MKVKNIIELCKGQYGYYLKCNEKNYQTDTEKITLEEAIKLIVGGFCSDVFNKLPMEFAMEARQLMELTLEDSIG